MPESTAGAVAPSSLRTVPRAVWIGGGLLSLVAAALAGALIVKSVEPSTPAVAPAASAMSLAAPATTPTGQPVPLIASAPATEPTLPSTVAKANPPATAPSPAPGVAPSGPWNAPGGTTRAALCKSCGVVESVTAVRKKGEGTGLGAVAGGVIGGVVGHQLGGGSGKSALTVLGAVGGGFAGHEIEKRARSTTAYDVHVRMDDGSARVLQRSEAIAVGTHVTVQGSTLKVVRNVPSGAPQHSPPKTPAPAGSPA